MIGKLERYGYIMLNRKTGMAAADSVDSSSSELMTHTTSNREVDQRCSAGGQNREFIVKLT